MLITSRFFYLCIPAHPCHGCPIATAMWQHIPRRAHQSSRQTRNVFRFCPDTSSPANKTANRHNDITRWPRVCTQLPGHRDIPTSGPVWTVRVCPLFHWAPCCGMMSWRRARWQFFRPSSTYEWQHPVERCHRKCGGGHPHGARISRKLTREKIYKEDIAPCDRDYSGVPGSRPPAHNLHN